MLHAHTKHVYSLQTKDFRGNAQGTALDRIQGPGANTPPPKLVLGFFNILEAMDYDDRDKHRHGRTRALLQA